MKPEARLNLGKLATIVGDVLELSQGKGTTRHRIVEAIFRTIRDALLRGERVYIRGLGLLTPRLRPPTRHSTSSFHGNRRHPVQEIRAFPPKLYIKFIPEENLLNALNGANQCRSRPPSNPKPCSTTPSPSKGR